MKRYYRVMLGQGSMHAEQCFLGSFIGADYGIHQDLTGKLPEDWRAFNREFIPIYLNNNAHKSKIAAGLACGALWTVAKGMLAEDMVLCPDGNNRYRVGVVAGDYHYVSGGVLPHRRPVRWLNQIIDRADMSDGLRYSAGSIGTVSNISRHSDEIEKLLGATTVPGSMATDESVEDQSAFALEKHLEDFLVENWAQTELGKHYDIFQDEGETKGQQFQTTDGGRIDILAISKDKRELLVVELKKGRASDAVVGQTQRYMGYVLQELAEAGQTVRGAIIAHEDDLKIRRALVVAPNIQFYRYEISFKLVKG